MGANVPCRSRPQFDEKVKALLEEGANVPPPWPAVAGPRRRDRPRPGPGHKPYHGRLRWVKDLWQWAAEAGRGRRDRPWADGAG